MSGAIANREHSFSWLLLLAYLVLGGMITKAFEEFHRAQQGSAEEQEAMREKEEALSDVGVRIMYLISPLSYATTIGTYVLTGRHGCHCIIVVANPSESHCSAVHLASPSAGEDSPPIPTAEVRLGAGEGAAAAETSLRRPHSQAVAERRQLRGAQPTAGGVPGGHRGDRREGLLPVVLLPGDAQGPLLCDGVGDVDEVLPAAESGHRRADWAGDGCGIAQRPPITCTAVVETK